MSAQGFVQSVVPLSQFERRVFRVCGCLVGLLACIFVTGIVLTVTAGRACPSGYEYVACSSDFHDDINDDGSSSSSRFARHVCHNCPGTVSKCSTTLCTKSDTCDGVETDGSPCRGADLGFKHKLAGEIGVIFIIVGVSVGCTLSCSSLPYFCCCRANQRRHNLTASPTRIHVSPCSPVSQLEGHQYLQCDGPLPVRAAYGQIQYGQASYGQVHYMPAAYDRSQCGQPGNGQAASEHIQLAQARYAPLTAGEYFPSSAKV
jgi:hypothetical protein